MAGIYIHIPFCKTRCVYCDFFSSTSMEKKAEYVQSVCEELRVRADYLKGHEIQTIYWGGGTPSQLSAADFEPIFEAIFALPNIFLPKADMEITLEANPDDITPEYLASLKHLPFNRISLGVQSFDDGELRFLNRRHDAQGAVRAVRLCQEAGFDNVSVDLIYGIPQQSLSVWKRNVQQALDLSVQHISAYHLIYEEGTALFRLLDAGKIQAVDEDTSLAMFDTLIDQLTAAGFEHYEISNFAKPGFRSRHNSSYWNGSYYIGIGSSAHSYNGVSRQWNGKSCVEEIEYLSEKERYADFIITRLRTAEGICLPELTALFGENARAQCLNQARIFIQQGLLVLKAPYCSEKLRKSTTTPEADRLRLTRKGLFLSDRIMAALLP